MTGLTGHKRATQGGFTLVELVVVIAILGVLAAIAVPALAGYLGRSKAQAYGADRERIQLAVDSYYSDPANPRFLGKRQYPVLGALKTAGTFYQGDNNTDAGTVVITGNPQGGTVTASPTWVDGGNGIRDAGEEALNDEDATVSAPGWHVQAITRQGTTYYVDSRDFFVNFELLVQEGLLDEVPKVASPDNKPPGSTTTYGGSYSWYVDESGRVKSLYHYFPEAGQVGFQDAYP